MKSSSATPAAYVAALPLERQAPIKKLRQVLKQNLPHGFAEIVDYGMIAYVVPLSIYAAGYHRDAKRPLPFISLASQKNYVSLYHMGLYEGPLLSWLEREWPRHTDAKLDLGKCCLRFRKLDQIPYALVGKLATKLTPEAWIAAYEQARQ
jgi:hypothetical protein